MSSVSNFCGLVALLFLVKFAESSFYEQNEDDSSSNHIQQENSQKAFDIQVHGILLWASMGFLTPLGILAMRMSSCTENSHPNSRHKVLFHIHAISQVLSVLVVTVGSVLSIRKFENAFDNSHQRIGLALYAAIYFQVVIACRRPKRGSRYRRIWYLLHWVIGTSTWLVGILNIYTGLQGYHKRTSKSTTLWTIVFTVQVSFVVIFYLFQDKWDYILKQGEEVIAFASNTTSTSPAAAGAAAAAQLMENQLNEVLNNIEPCRTSNALGTHFSRTNALNKLFRLT